MKTMKKNLHDKAFDTTYIFKILKQ